MKWICTILGAFFLLRGFYLLSTVRQYNNEMPQYYSWVHEAVREMSPRNAYRPNLENIQTVAYILIISGIILLYKGINKIKDDESKANDYKPDNEKYVRKKREITLLSNIEFCNNCKKVVHPDDDICPKCGVELNE